LPPGAPQTTRRTLAKLPRARATAVVTVRSAGPRRSAPHGTSTSQQARGRALPLPGDPDEHRQRRTRVPMFRMCTSVTARHVHAASALPMHLPSRRACPTLDHPSPSGTKHGSPPPARIRQGEARSGTAGHDATECEDDTARSSPCLAEIPRQELGRSVEARTQRDGTVRGRWIRTLLILRIAAGRAGACNGVRCARRYSEY
jgi:hypothetical protein